MMTQIETRDSMLAEEAMEHVEASWRQKAIQITTPNGVGFLRYIGDGKTKGPWCANIPLPFIHTREDLTALEAETVENAIWEAETARIVDIEVTPWGDDDDDANE